jgi:hypothetical protein
VGPSASDAWLGRGADRGVPFVPVGSVIVTAGAVHVTVRELLGGRVANVDDLDLEVQRLTGERMVAVDLRIVALHGFDDEHVRAGARLELNARPDARLAAGQLPHGHVSDQAGLMEPVAFLGSNADLELRADGLPLERLLQPGDDVASAVQIRERSAPTRSIDRTPRIIGERVFE